MKARRDMVRGQETHMLGLRPGNHSPALRVSSNKPELIGDFVVVDI
jgi:hypothetical protein